MKCDLMNPVCVIFASVAIFAGCSTTDVQQQPVVVAAAPAPYDWTLPQGFSPDSVKSRVGIRIVAPVKTDGSLLPPGLSGQFLEFAKSKIVQSRRFVVYTGDAKVADSDVLVTPFVDYITQTQRVDGRDWHHVIAQMSLDVKFAAREDGAVQEAITFKGVSKASVPSVFGQPARNVDEAGLMNKAFDEVYRMLMQSIDRRFPVSVPATARIFGKTVKILADGGSNVGLDRGRDHMLYMIDKDGVPVVLGRLVGENLGLDRATFKVVEWRPDEEAAHYVQKMLNKAELDIFVAQK